MANPSGGRVRWMMVIMAFLGTSINYIDRANLGVAMPSLKAELHLGPEDVGLVLGAFFWTYALFQLPAGWFIDRVGPRIAYTLAVTWWSFFTAAAAAARGFASMFGIRLLLGAGEAPAYPTNAKIVSEWFPKSERAFATSIFDSGARVGTFLAFLICPFIITTLGWRASFLITGALGLIWAVVWWRFYRHPKDHTWVSEQERAYIAAGQVPAKVGAPKVPWRSLFKYRTVWGMMLGFFCLNFVMYFFITWFPTYLVQARGFKILKMGLYGSIPSLVGVPMGYLGGLTSDYLVRRGVRLNWARKIPIVAGMTVASCIGLAVLVPSAVHAMILLSLCNGSICFAAASIWSLPADVAPTPGHIASIGGIQNFASNTAGICTTYIVGKLLAKTGDFVAPLMVAGGFALLGALSYLFVVPEIEPLKVKDPQG
jgi:ACS family D-galactonate transporter-like MFS transporter